MELSTSDYAGRRDVSRNFRAIPNQGTTLEIPELNSSPHLVFIRHFSHGQGVQPFHPHRPLCYLSLQRIKFSQLLHFALEAKWGINSSQEDNQKGCNTTACDCSAGNRDNDYCIALNSKPVVFGMFLKHFERKGLKHSKFLKKRFQCTKSKVCMTNDHLTKF